MRRLNVGWWTFILTLVVLLAPVRAHADYYWYYGGSQVGGTTDPTGDPDDPMNPKMSPNTGIGTINGNGAGYHRSPAGMNQEWMRRYLTLLSGLRSYYMHF